MPDRMPWEDVKGESSTRSDTFMQQVAGVRKRPPTTPRQSPELLPNMFESFGFLAFVLPQIGQA